MTAIGVFANRRMPIEFVDELRRCADNRIQIPEMRDRLPMEPWLGVLGRHAAAQRMGNDTAPLHQEIVTLRQVLKTALRHGWLDRLHDFSQSYRTSPRISLIVRGSLENSTRNSTRRRDSARMIEKYYAAHIKTCSMLLQSTSCGPRKTRKARKPSRTLRLHRNLQVWKRMCKIGQRALS